LRVLLAEDDAMIGASVRRGLSQDGFTVDWVEDGRAAELALAERVHDAVLLDLGLPRKSGLEVLSAMRRGGDTRPVLIMTARDAIADRVAGLDAGADDYVVKPFDLTELAARLRALSRRRAVASAQVQMSPQTSRRLRDLPKGDALAAAQLAGIMAAKRTSELIPLCHPLPLSHIEVTLDVQDGVVGIVAVAETTAQTGVEMEALTAASVAALTLYDMCKAVDKAMTIGELRLIEKTKEEV